MYYVAKFLVWMAFHIAFNLKFEGKNNIPKKKSVIYVSNHRTFADPPLVACGARGKYVFMAKEELFRNRLFAWFIRKLGAFSVSRGNGDMGALDTAVESLNNGRSLIIFPEGTRSKDGKVLRGHSGAAAIAVRADKLIIPVGIVFGEKLKFRTKLVVKYGEPINPRKYVDDMEKPNPRQLANLKKRYMADITRLVEGDEQEEEKGNE